MTAPYFTVEPEIVNAAEGETVEFTCAASGVPEPQISWIHNGQPIDKAPYNARRTVSQKKIIIERLVKNDTGNYGCNATNSLGYVYKDVYVNVLALAPEITDPPRDTSTVDGKTVTLTCRVFGAPKPQVKWNTDGGIKSINNSRITLDPEGNLWFSNVTRDDASDDFTYACSATSIFRNEYKIGNRVLLNVLATGTSASQNRHEPTQQYVTRKNEVALRGKKVELYCIFGGTPLPQIRWTKKGGPLPLDRVSQGNYGKSLIIKHVTFEDQDNYNCEATNGVGQAKSYSIDLKVLAAPYFTVEPEIVNAAEGETVEFTCAASGVPEPQISWIHNGQPIDKAPYNARRTVSQKKIIIERLVKNDTGNYGCNATNSLGYVYKDVYVNVLALAPEITDPPRDTSTVDGKTVTLTCRVFGAPKPQVKWVRAGVELTGGRYTILENGDLQIKDTTFFDAGEYNCHAVNKFGSADAQGSLTVKEHTKITDLPEDYEVAAGTTATFRCNAVSDSSLKLNIGWMNENQPIDFEAEPRFVISSDYSLTITKTTELDSGTYTCVASTELDEVTAKATLTVQDVPNPPKLLTLLCNRRDASVQWQPMGDNRAPILRYTIQYNTSFTPDTWEVAFDSVPATESIYTVAMSPWSNYTFRVLALNKIGLSLPSPHSSICTTQPDVPYKNPENVEGKGTQPDNLVITWTPMPQIEHNAPRFQYRVSWKRDIAGEPWTAEDVPDWTVGKLEVPNQPTFQQYRIKVVAINEKGESNVAAKEVVGYSGEDVPMLPPRNFSVLTVTDSTSALLSWEPVTPESVRGEFKGYKIQTWTERDGEENLREIHIPSDTNRALINKFVPHSKNYARILAYNGHYNGPPSDTIFFTTPEGIPGSVQYFQAIPMGSSALFLVWQPPEHPNGVLTGYRIYYQTMKGTKVGPLLERDPITDPKQTRAKLAGLQPGTKYRVHIKATTRAGEGVGYLIEQRTRASAAVIPDPPKFKWYRLPTDNGQASVKVVWLPDIDGKPGSHFFVKYKQRGETMYEQTDPQLEEDFIIVRGLKPGETYDMQVVAVDGEYMTASDAEEVETYTVTGQYNYGQCTLWF
ncbi:hypothetical protein B566_EDAN006694 [Ephemera danica]|nr:hypothetical protein B566_EDAN006694 [Ephemera danica]